MHSMIRWKEFCNWSTLSEIAGGCRGSNIFGGVGGLRREHSYRFPLAFEEMCLVIFVQIVGFW